MAIRPPPIPAAAAARADTQTLVATTDRPVIRAAGSLHRTALTAKPNVERRKVATPRARRQKMASSSQLSVVLVEAKEGGLTAIPAPKLLMELSWKTRLSTSSPKASVTRAT